VTGLGSLYASDNAATRPLRLIYQALQSSACRVSDLTIFQNHDDVRQLIDAGVVAAAKATVTALTRACAHELGPHGITVNCICPGFVLDAMDLPGCGPRRADPWSALSPLGRIADSGDIARAALFLASNDSDYLTGEKDAGISSLFSWRTGRTPLCAGQPVPGRRDSSRTRARSARSL